MTGFIKRIDGDNKSKAITAEIQGGVSSTQTKSVRVRIANLAR